VRVFARPTKVFAKKMHTMALDQFALLELLDALKAADADDVVRRSLEAVLYHGGETPPVYSGSGPH
jgi:hypothetical protein